MVDTPRCNDSYLHLDRDHGVSVRVFEAKYCTNHVVYAGPRSMQPLWYIPLRWKGWAWLPSGVRWSSSSDPRGTCPPTPSSTWQPPNRKKERKLTKPDRYHRIKTKAKIAQGNRMRMYFRSETDSASKGFIRKTHKIWNTHYVLRCQYQNTSWPANNVIRLHLPTIKNYHEMWHLQEVYRNYSSSHCLSWQR